MTDEKGLDPKVADSIGEYVNQRGLRDLLSSLQSNETLTSNESAQKGLADMELLFNYLEAFDVLDKVQFDLSLARGLDYYTGVIFEVVTEGSAPSTLSSSQDGPSSGEVKATTKPRRPPKKEEDPDEDRSADPSVGVGSIAAGGRYDELVGMFSGKGQIPCVGISFGIDRIFSLIKSRMESSSSAPSSFLPSIRATEIDVFVMAFGGKGFTGMLKERIQVTRRLWDNGIPATFSHKVKPKLPAQFKAAEADEVPFAVILGEEEQAKGMVRIKELGLPQGHPEKDGVLVQIEGLVEEVKGRVRRKLDWGSGPEQEQEQQQQIDGKKDGVERKMEEVKVSE